MKHIALAVIAAVSLSACTTKDADTSKVASASSTPHAQVETSGQPDLAKLGSLPAPAAIKKQAWKDLDETSRYLLIMGTVDGFAAAGAGSPCYPGNDNAKLDARLMAKNFGSKHPDGLPSALADLSAEKSDCAVPGKRGYNSDLLKSMSNEHLATYLSAAVRGYAHLKTCPVSNHGYAAATIAADLYGLQSAKSPADVIAPAMVTSCAFKPE